MFNINFNQVTNKKLYLQIYDQILYEIQSGSIKVGDKLPPERELCEQFGVSRAPIRQALSALELNGFIYSRQGEGIYVRNNSLVKSGSQSSVILESVAPEDIVEARMNIEPIIASFAAERANEEDIESIRKTISDMEKETQAGIYAPETDEKLHNSIAKASHNDLFIKFMSDITSAMKQQELWTFIRDRTVTRPEFREVNFSEHKLIIKAIEDHNPEEAKKTMSNHMNNLYGRYWRD